MGRAHLLRRGFHRRRRHDRQLRPGTAATARLTAPGVRPPTPTPTAGSKTVTLTVTDNDGATATDTLMVTVQRGAGRERRCGPDRPIGQVLSFSGAASTDADGTIASYSWNWGDGTPTAPASAPPTPTPPQAPRPSR